MKLLLVLIVTTVNAFYVTDEFKDNNGSNQTEITKYLFRGYKYHNMPNLAEKQPVDVGRATYSTVSVPRRRTVSTKELRMILDGDPGADDSMAWMMVGSRRSPADVLAITTVRGNTGVINATRNALLVLQTINRQEIPVFSGSRSGIIFQGILDNYYGYDGLGDVFNNKPPYDLRAPGHAAIAMGDIVRRNPGNVIILLTGPMTNLALALHYYPEIIENAKDIVFLGGSYKGPGNPRPGIEFNVNSDPEAVALVLQHVPRGKPITFVPMDIIDDIAIPVDWRKNVLGKLNTCKTDFMNKAEMVSLRKDKFWTPFDQLASIVAMEPSVVKSTTLACVSVETCGGQNSRGGIVIGGSGECNEPNVKFVTAVDRDIFMDTMIRYMNSTEDCTGRVNSHLKFDSPETKL